jgi:hypothetical protein
LRYAFEGIVGSIFFARLYLLDLAHLAFARFLVWSSYACCTAAKLLGMKKRSGIGSSSFGLFVRGIHAAHPTY